MKDKWPRATRSAPRTRPSVLTRGAGWKETTPRAAHSPTQLLPGTIQSLKPHFPFLQTILSLPNSHATILEASQRCHVHHLWFFFVLEKNFRSHGADAKSKPAPSQENFNQFLLLLVLMGNYTLESADKVHRFLPADFFIHQCHYTAVQLLIFLSQTNMSLN